jgi:hypothetical protein
MRTHQTALDHTNPAGYNTLTFENSHKGEAFKKSPEDLMKTLNRFLKQILYGLRG